MQLNMRGRLGGAGGAVLDECDQAAVGDARREQLGRRDAREVAEVAVEVRLVVVAARVGDVGERAAGLEQPPGAREAQDAAQRLGRQAELLAERRREVAAAVAERAGEVADAGPAVGRDEATPGPDELALRRRLGLEAAAELAVEQREALLP